MRPAPLFFVSVDSKQFSFLVSLLESTLVGAHVSVDSNGVKFASKLCMLCAFLKRSLCGILRKEAPAGSKRNSNKRKSGA